jgi:UDP-N-acetylmuramoyl-L-alanyl-D-glutamate--2,6-diaminopimelate ligase
MSRRRRALFACIPGARTDGHEHAAAAVSAGAVALLVERPLALGVTEARVADTRVALGPVAARFFGRPSRAMRCLGVTGTNGKTTTTYLLESIARAAGERVGVVGTTGARVDGDAVALDHTTPEAPNLRTCSPGCGRRAGSSPWRSRPTRAPPSDGTHFTAVCFTNLSHDHLDFHGDLGVLLEARSRAHRCRRHEPRRERTVLATRKWAAAGRDYGTTPTMPTFGDRRRAGRDGNTFRAD